VIIVGNPRYRLISLAVTVVILIVVYFAIIKPTNNTVDNAIKSSNQQVQQALKQANQQSNGAASSAVKLAACVTAAGTDASKLSACQAKYTP
jgi:F0F1-type ATP synthase membrane subunit b/b'